jgi:hypothetical protein
VAAGRRVWWRAEARLFPAATRSYGATIKGKISWSTVDRVYLSKFGKFGQVRAGGLQRPFLRVIAKDGEARPRPCGQARGTCTLPPAACAAALSYRHPVALGPTGCSSGLLESRATDSPPVCRSLCAGHDAQKHRELWKGAEPNFRSRAPPGAKGTWRARSIVARRGRSTVHCTQTTTLARVTARRLSRISPSDPPTPEPPQHMPPDAARERLAVAHTACSAVVLSCMSPSSMVQPDLDPWAQMSLRP